MVKLKCVVDMKILNIAFLVIKVSQRTIEFLRKVHQREPHFVVPSTATMPTESVICGAIAVWALPN